MTISTITRSLQKELPIPASYGYTWSGEYDFELRAKERLKLILPIVFFMVFLLLYMVFHSEAEAAVLSVPTQQRACEQGRWDTSLRSRWVCISHLDSQLDRGCSA